MEHDAAAYVSYSDKIKRLTYEELNCDSVTIDILNDRSRSVLERNGIKELFPV